jgi:hypothetical protein
VAAEAHNSPDCPYCGATGNEPGARFCTKCHLQLPTLAATQSEAPDDLANQATTLAQPVVKGTEVTDASGVAPALARMSWVAANRKLVLFGGSLAAVLGTVGALIALGQTAASTEAQTIRAVLIQQPTVDAAMGRFLSAGGIDQKTGLNVIRAESDRRLTQYRVALATVRQHEAALQQQQSTLASLGPLSLGDGPGSALDRRVGAALSGLSQANQVLTAAVDQSTLERAVFETVLEEQQMLDAIKQQQYMQADRIDADADHALLPAEWRSHYKDVPPQTARLVGFVRLIIDSTDSIAIFTFRNQADPLAYWRSQLNSAIEGYNTLSSDAAAAQNNDWNSTQYGPRVAAYDSAMGQIGKIDS